jgi:hypothetical protein
LTRKTLALLVAALIAVSAALLLPGMAFASTCSSSSQWSILNQPSSGLAVGGSWHESVIPHSYTYHAGTFRDNLEIIVGSSIFQVGVIRDSHGLSTYVERDGAFYAKENANVGTAYAASISRTDSSTVTLGDGNGGSVKFAYPGGGNLLSTGAYNGGQAGGTCNAFSFTNGGPETPFNLLTWDYGFQQGQYDITNRTSSSFNVGGS